MKNYENINLLPYTFLHEKVEYEKGHPPFEPEVFLHVLPLQVNVYAVFIHVKVYYNDNNNKVSHKVYMSYQYKLLNQIDAFPISGSISVSHAKEILPCFSEMMESYSIELEKANIGVKQRFTENQLMQMLSMAEILPDKTNN